jgi:hypothetical protein
MRSHDTNRARIADRVSTDSEHIQAQFTHVNKYQTPMFRQKNGRRKDGKTGRREDGKAERREDGQMDRQKDRKTERREDETMRRWETERREDGAGILENDTARRSRVEARIHLRVKERQHH